MARIYPFNSDRWVRIQENDKEGSLFKTYVDDTLQGEPVEHTVEFNAPFLKPDREVDYRVAWEVFEQRGG